MFVCFKQSNTHTEQILRSHQNYNMPTKLETEISIC